MKRAALVVCLLFSQSVMAENWWNISTSKDRTSKLMVDIDSIKLVKHDTGVAIMGIMQYISKDPIYPFGAAIDVEDCIARGKGKLIQVVSEDKTEELDWTMDGTTGGDAQGQFLCGFAKEIFKPKDNTRKIMV